MHGNLDYTKRSLKSNMRVPYWILKRDRESLLKGRKLFENIFGEPVEGRVNLITSPLIYSRNAINASPNLGYK